MSKLEHFRESSFLKKKVEKIIINILCYHANRGQPFTQHIVEDYIRNAFLKA